MIVLSYDPSVMWRGGRGEGRGGQRREGKGAELYCTLCRACYILCVYCTLCVPMLIVRPIYLNTSMRCLAAAPAADARGEGADEGGYAAGHGCGHQGYWAGGSVRQD